MVVLRDGFKQKAEEAARIVDEYKQRLTQVIEETGEQIREEAEREAAAVMARANEEKEVVQSLSSGRLKRVWQMREAKGAPCRCQDG